MNLIEKRTSLLLLVGFFVALTGRSQLYFEDFEGGAPGVSMNNGAEGGEAGNGDNFWIINDEYGNGPFVLGGQTMDDTPDQPAGINNSPQSNYLHITSNAAGTKNAHVDPLTPAGESYFTEIATGVNTQANPGVQLHFWFLNSATETEAEVYAKDGPGGTWQLLDPNDFTTQLSNQTGSWDSTTYKGNLLDNKTDLYIGFRYEFDDAAANPYYPAFSVDDITLALPDVVEANVINPDPLPVEFCPGDQVTFEAETNSAIGNYQWNFDGANTGAQSINGPSSVTFEAGNPGNYTFELLVTDGVNEDVFTWTVEIIPCDPPDLAFTGSPRTICAEQSVSFEDLTDEGSAPIESTEWTFPGGTPGTSTSSNPIVVYNTAGLYDVTLTVTDSNGTYDTTAVEYIEVENCPPPEADFDVVGDNRLICPGACINFEDLSDNMDGTGLIWEWTFEGGVPRISNDQNPEEICYQEPGLYRVSLEVTNSVGSDSKSLAGFIEVDSCRAPEVKFSVERDSICPGNCVQFYNNTRSLNAESDSIVWSFEGADAPYQTSREAEPVVCYSTPGVYRVSLLVENDYGTDELIEQEYISVREMPNVQIVNPANDQDFEDGSRELLIDRSARLRALGDGGEGSTFEWSPDREISCLNCQTVTVSPKENTFYYVTHKNANGCERTDSVRVIVIEQYYSGVPEAFSPNGDGDNDELFLRGNGIEEMQFFVYNRHGEKVFESHTQDLGWDGTYKGRDLDPGVFKYFARITYLNGYQEVIQGEVNLIR